MAPRLYLTGVKLLCYENPSAQQCGGAVSAVPDAGLQEARAELVGAQLHRVRLDHLRAQRHAHLLAPVGGQTVPCLRSDRAVHEHLVEHAVALPLRVVLEHALQHLLAVRPARRVDTCPK